VLIRNIFMVFILATSCVQATEIEAVLEWADRRVAAFAVAGVVDKVYVVAGDVVKKGQLLAQLDQSPFESMNKKQQALVTGIKPLLFDARQNYSQAQELYDRTVLSQVELQRAEAQYQGVEAEQLAAKADQDLAQWNQQRSMLRAACECLIVSNQLLPGMVVNIENQASAIMVLAEMTVMNAVIVMEPAMQLLMQQAVTINVAGKKYAAKVVSISVENGKRWARLQFRPEATQKLYAGQTAKVSF
jgi:multidrug efflux pump subunit AcrA (membrane-fusion protein)